MAGNVKVLFNHLPRMQAQAPAAIKGTVAEAALNLQRYAKDLCPADTGALRASIHTTPTNNGMTQEVQAGKNELSGDSTTPTAEYAIYVEFGTRKMRAQPFMRPAAEKIRKEYPGMLVETIVKVAKGQG